MPFLAENISLFNSYADLEGNYAAAKLARVSSYDKRVDLGYVTGEKTPHS